MEASEMPKISLNRAETRGILGLVGDDSAVKELISNDDRGSGFARLDLMLSTVLDRLTKVEPPASEADV
jgi:hypothetical protein